MAKWRDFVRKHDLKEPDSPEDDELKTRKLLAEVKQAEIKLKVMEGTYVPIEKVREVWLTHIGQVRNILESRFLNELPPILTTLDAIQIREKMQEVLDETYSALSVAADSIKEQRGCASVPFGDNPYSFSVWELVFRQNSQAFFYGFIVAFPVGFADVAQSQFAWRTRYGNSENLCILQWL